MPNISIFDLGFIFQFISRRVLQLSKNVKKKQLELTLSNCFKINLYSYSYSELPYHILFIFMRTYSYKFCRRYINIFKTIIILSIIFLLSSLSQHHYHFFYYLITLYYQFILPYYIIFPLCFYNQILNWLTLEHSTLLNFLSLLRWFIHFQRKRVQGSQVRLIFQLIQYSVFHSLALAV